MSAKLVHSYALFSIAAAILTIALKFEADSLTGSVGLLSDALESDLINDSPEIACGFNQISS